MTLQAEKFDDFFPLSGLDIQNAGWSSEIEGNEQV